MAFVNGLGPAGHDPGFWLACMVLAVLAIAGLWDIMALFGIIDGHTITFYIQAWSKGSPVIPFAAGILVGHLFFTIGR